MLQESHYYPFGAQIEGLSRLYDPPGGVPYATNLDYVYEEEEDPTYIEYLQYTHDLKRYNGKEFNRELGLNWYDYGARWYDPVIGRWNAVDPLAEKFYNWNSYNYVLNNPIRLIDPDGRSPNGGDPTQLYNKEIPTGGGGSYTYTGPSLVAALTYLFFGEGDTKTKTEPKPGKNPELPPVGTDDDCDDYVSIYKAPKTGKTAELLSGNGFNDKNFPYDPTPFSNKDGKAYFAEDKEEAEVYARRDAYDSVVIEVQIPMETYIERKIYRDREVLTKTSKKTTYQYKIGKENFDVLNSSKKVLHPVLTPW